MRIRILLSNNSGIILDLGGGVIGSVCCAEEFSFYRAGKALSYISEY
jgi:hypothetical protein